MCWPSPPPRHASCVRNALVCATALLLPLGIGVLLVSNGEDGRWGDVFGDAARPAAAVLRLRDGDDLARGARRQLVLKRLRSGELSDAEILTGLLAPLYALAALQSALLLTVAVAFGAPFPDRPWLLVSGLGLGALMSAAAALATAAFTASAELAQITVAPFLFAMIASAGWVLSVAPDAVSALMLATPGGALADLIREAWDTGGRPLAAIASLLAWTVIARLVAKRNFSWEPRT